jgi:lipopolysaccharide/colanic/teichoic acid biosynthesis glycosyltransferase
VIVVLLALVAVLLWILRQAFGPLIAEEARGSLDAWCEHLATRAARSLPPETAEGLEEDWLAELATLERRPLSALRFALGLSRAARGIARHASPVRPPVGYPAFARLCDLITASTVLVLFGPYLLAICLVVKISGPGPILVRRARLGEGGRAFGALSFRTSRRIDSALPTFGPQDRLSEVGRVLKRLALDQLPAFYNILRGDIAVIGPPPQLPCSEDEPLDARPGLVSWWALQKIGGIDIGEAEARRRDLARGLSNDLRLLLTAVAVQMKGRTIR